MTMHILDETTEADVCARRFDLQVGDETVPGMHWLPREPAQQHATICIGHGGFQHKLYGNVPELAVQLAQNLGVGVVALDAPNHGDRITDPDAAKRARDAAVRAASEGRGLRLDPKVRDAMAARVAMHVAEWRALLDALQTDDRWRDGPFGWWGVSMGTSHGIPLVAEDGRIAAAVFGLNALAPGDETLARQAGVDHHPDPLPHPVRRRVDDARRGACALGCLRVEAQDVAPQPRGSRAGPALRTAGQRGLLPPPPRHRLSGAPPRRRCAAT